MFSSSLLASLWGGRLPGPLGLQGPHCSLVQRTPGKGSLGVGEVWVPLKSCYGLSLALPQFSPEKWACVCNVAELWVSVVQRVQVAGSGPGWKACAASGLAVQGRAGGRGGRRGSGSSVAASRPFITVPAEDVL